MGYRLHFAKVHKVEWEGGYFGGMDVDSVRQLLEEHDAMNWYDENADNWELGKAGVKTMIATLRKKPNAKNEFVEEDTNGEIADIFQHILDEAEPEEDYIRIEWF